MAEKNNINKYSAADIEKYHKGQLTPEEMNAMEKAALDDPFLADAMEGYKHEGVDAAPDISSLQEKLKQRIGGSKIVELKSKQIPTWLKAAASIIIILGAGILVYQFAINNKVDKVAKLQETKQQEGASTSPQADSLKTTNSIKDQSAEQPGIPANENKKEKAPIPSQEIDVAKNLSDTIPTNTGEATAFSIAEKQDTGFYDANRSVPQIQSSTAPGVQKSKKADEDGQGLAGSNKSSAKMKQAQFINPNVFRGQVIDANNNALPFVNISSTRDKVGTYSDAKGNFILTSPDSVLNVQIKSVGFENSVVMLRNDLPRNQVILQEDTKNLNEVVINNTKANTNRRKFTKTKIEEPEPTDGWENYDTYIVNNLNIPDQIRINSPESREVQISFDVNKDGSPVNIKVEKSLCRECDMEAIRLLKDGPKWKRRGKKNRGTVTVPFQ